MKRIIFSMATIATLTLASCSGSSKTTETVDSLANAATVVEEETVGVTEIEELPADVQTPTDAEAVSLVDKIKSAASKENVAKGIAYVKGLISSGKLADAKSYLEQIKPYADKVGLGTALASVENALCKAEELSGAKDASVDAAKAKAGEVKESAKEKVEAKANELTDKAKEGIQKGVDATKDAAQKGVNAVKGMID